MKMIERWKMSKGKQSLKMGLCLYIGGVEGRGYEKVKRNVYRRRCRGDGV